MIKIALSDYVILFLETSQSNIGQISKKICFISIRTRTFSSQNIAMIIQVSL